MKEQLQTTAVLILSLRDFTNIEIAALNNCISGFGRVNTGNCAFNKAVWYGIVQPNGYPNNTDEKELLLDALSYTITKRMENGEWE